MTGVIQFDRDAALADAARVFWRQGYGATSVQDLEAATSLGRGSLYNAFGGKKALFLAALERYSEAVAAPLLGHLAAPDVGAGIEAMLMEIVARVDEPGRPRGCLLTNTCLESGGAPEVETFVAAAMRAKETALEAAILRARDQGEIEPDADPRALARFYAAVMQSLGLLHKALVERERLEDVVKVALAAWPRRAA